MNLKNFSATLLLIATALLAGCSAFIVTEEEQWPAAQRMANIQAVVAFDETYSGFALSNHSRRAGAAPIVKQYRKAIVTILNGDDEQPIFGKTGVAGAIALVPDGMPALRKGDLVEIRHVRLFGGLQDFDKTGDGNAVLRLLCPESPDRKDSETFKSCASNANWQKRWGEKHRYYTGILASPSGRPYAKNLKEHKELSFTPYYDDKGAPIPAAIPMGARPDINNWVYPRF